ncbi:MAG: hypothetical protein D8M58_13405 [Calditrichaeota bacterium]|nr:MAG: hypothetical protein DWQ03_00370 [Calditrichota bacterium]MBL1206395.1 hypothetical protein [Calditrichota bacterium]NOG46221.1 hypothetical protein [Calditrichota bacterium]
MPKISKKWLEHIISFALISVLLISLIIYFNNIQKRSQLSQNREIERWLNLDFLDFDNPMHRAILEESLNIFEPWQDQKHAGLIEDIVTYRQQQVLKSTVNNDGQSPITTRQVWTIAWMYLKFIFVYVITLVLTWYGVQTLGIYRFIRLKQKRQAYLIEMYFYIKKQTGFKNWKQYWEDYKPALVLFLKAIGKGFAYMVLFSPAYVLAYSFRTKFDTDMLVFMVLLGLISNAILITYTHKFFTFLVSESRRGYVQTAIVKNMFNSYKMNASDGISCRRIIQWNKIFPGHVFGHIYKNARFQYLATIKEQASFLITGLIIIEMALNIQDHLSYELLQNILYKNFAIVALIVLGIYYLVKATEVFVDWMIERESKLYNNN